MWAMVTVVCWCEESVVKVYVVPSSWWLSSDETLFVVCGPVKGLSIGMHARAHVWLLPEPHVHVDRRQMSWKLHVRRRDGAVWQVGTAAATA